MNSYTFRLLKGNQTFLGGMSALLDLSDVTKKYNYNETDTEADCESIKADWMAIGADMQVAVDQYGKEVA